jgi:branched-chain amino acid transport system ATP-binding protein
MADNSSLTVKGVGLSFGGLSVLRDVHFTVAAGELKALIGPNGAGKTSMLNCISRIYRPNSGRIRLGDADLLALPGHRLARAGVARTFQHGEVFPHMSVIDNLLVARHAHMRGNLLAEGLFLPAVRAREVAEREAVERVIEFCELERVRHRLVGALAFGVQKLVGFARALAMEPRLLLLDEPSAGLTREEKEHLARFILRAKAEMDLTMLWVEHDMQMVADLADSIVVLDFGQIITDGPPDEVLSDPAVIAAYLGSAGETGTGAGA